MFKGFKTFVEVHIVEAHQKMANVSTKRKKEDEKYMEWKKYVTHFDGLPNGEDLENKPPSMTIVITTSILIIVVHTSLGFILLLLLHVWRCHFVLVRWSYF